MAALCTKCARKLHILRISCQNSLRFLSAAASSNPSAEGYEGDNRSSSRKRDPLAVLKALASTVQTNQWMPDPEFVEDIFLLPRSRYKQRECLLAKQSGRKAATYVIQKCPWIFPLREPIPAWPVDEELTSLDSIQKEEDLNRAISEKNAKKAVLYYETLKEKGVEVSLDTENRLLDLAAQVLGDISAEETLSHSEEEEYSSLKPVEQEHEEEDKDSDLESSDQEEDNRMIFEEEHKVETHSWRDDNYASKMFNSMAAKNGQTYEAFILGLLQHRHPLKAFEIFDEARANGYQVSVWTYNSMLDAIQYSTVDQKTGLVQKMVNHMNEEPVVLPNVGTYNALLRNAVKGYDGRSRINTAFGLIRDMFAVGFEPSLESLNQVLRAEYIHHWDLKRSLKAQEKQRYFVSAAVLNEVITYLESLPELPRLQDSQDFYFFRTAMSAAYLCMDVKLAIRIYDLVKKDDNDRFLGAVQAPYYSTFLLALISGELNPYTVYEYYKEIVPDKLRPRDYVYASLFNMAHKTNNPRIVPKLYEDMRLQRVALTPSVAEAMFKALGRVDGPKAAKEHLSIMLDVLRWLKLFEIMVTPSILCQLIRMLCLNGKVEEAWNSLSLFPKDTAPPYSALFQILLAARDKGDRNKVVETFQMLAEFGYTINKKKRLSIYDVVGLPSDDRNFINSLFGDMSVLDQRRKLQKSPESRFNLV